MVDQLIPQESKNPNEQLAQAIVDQLVHEGLLTEKRSADALKKIQTGKASASDWRLWAEEVLPREGNENAATPGN